MGIILLAVICFPEHVRQRKRERGGTWKVAEVALGSAESASDERASLDRFLALFVFSPCQRRRAIGVIQFASDDKSGNRSLTTRRVDANVGETSTCTGVVSSAWCSAIIARFRFDSSHIHDQRCALHIQDKSDV